MEGYTFDQTIKELNNIFTDTEDGAICEDSELSNCVPQSIRDMAGYRTAIEALGGMAW